MHLDWKTPVQLWFRAGFQALLFALFLGILAGSPAKAGPLEDAVPLFAADSFADTAKALDLVAASGAAHAGPMLEALVDRRLFVSADKKLFFKDKAGLAFDGLSGEKLAAEPAGGAMVRINNRLRGAIDTAVGRLTLQAPDPVKRRAAAEAVYKTRAPESEEALTAALKVEKVAAIKDIQQMALAAIVATAPGKADIDRLSAIEILRDRGDRDALTPLNSIPESASADVKAAAKAAAVDINQRLALWSGVQNAWYGISLGSVLLLAAIGLAITFGVMGIINMAHGEMVMIGAYTTFLIQEVIRQKYPALFDYSLAIAIPLSFLVAGLVGIAIERLVIRHLYGRPLETLLATWGISLILQQAVRTLFGPTNREVGAPAYMSGSFKVGLIDITYGRVWIVGFALVVFFAVLALLRFTPLGLQMRAVTQNRRMAASMGIRTARVDALTFGLGSGIAGLAGVALSQIDNVSPNLGQSYIIDSFMVVVFGGVGNLWGTLVAALSLGIANKFLEPFAGAVLGKIALLVFIILFIQKRPRGLFALKGRAIEQ
ncbi:MAG: branched-chain amino acid transport system permease [Beijerinckiaceae bacterium]|nr:MAG: branched-chain amino acid transport system permease [Beijerinckiaceae bacterium]